MKEACFEGGRRQKEGGMEEERGGGTNREVERKIVKEEQRISHYLS